MKQTDHVRHLILARVEKGELIPDNTASKATFRYLSTITTKSSVLTWVPECQGGKF